LAISVYQFYKKLGEWLATRHVDRSQLYFTVPSSNTKGNVPILFLFNKQLPGEMKHGVVSTDPEKPHV
jgi:hypothetical protein